MPFFEGLVPVLHAVVAVVGWVRYRYYYVGVGY